MIPQSYLNTQCIFCLGNTMLPVGPRFFVGFCRLRKAREHVENVHLRSLGADEALACPLGGENFEGIVRSKNHAASAATVV
jgi:hypothetical protein